MSYYVVFPGPLLAPLLALLPPEERPAYAAQFERVVGDLVWVQADADNAVTTALRHVKAPQAIVWQQDAAVRQELANELMELENDTLTALVQIGLVTMASDLLTRRLRAVQTVLSPAPDTSDPAV